MKKNLMTVLILALLVVNIVLTSVMLVSIVGTNKKTAQLVDNITTAMNLELTVPGDEETTNVALTDTEVYNIAVEWCKINNSKHRRIRKCVGELTESNRFRTCHSNLYILAQIYRKVRRDQSAVMLEYDLQGS